MDLCSPAHRLIYLSAHCTCAWVGVHTFTVHLYSISYVNTCFFFFFFVEEQRCKFRTCQVRFDECLEDTVLLWNTTIEVVCNSSKQRSACVSHCLMTSSSSSNIICHLSFDSIYCIYSYSVFNLMCSQTPRFCCTWHKASATSPFTKVCIID